MKRGENRFHKLADVYILCDILAQDRIIRGVRKRVSSTKQKNLNEFVCIMYKFKAQIMHDEMLQSRGRSTSSVDTPVLVEKGAP